MADLTGRWPAGGLRRRPRAAAPWVRAAAGAAGPGRSEAVPLHLIGAPFQIKVWEALLAIPSGHVTTYSEIARAIGHPRAVRAVGTAVGRNPVSFLIPCHRALRKSGGLGGYHWGLPVKRAMLAWEWPAAGPERRPCADRCRFRGAVWPWEMARGCLLWKANPSIYANHTRPRHDPSTHPYLPFLAGTSLVAVTACTDPATVGGTDPNATPSRGRCWAACSGPGWARPCPTTRARARSSAASPGPRPGPRLATASTSRRPSCAASWKTTASGSPTPATG